MSVKKDNTERALKVFTAYVEKTSRENLVKKRKNTTGNLSKSIKGNYKVSANSFQLFFEMEDYGQFQDLGVQGFVKGAKNKAPDSPFRMGTGTAPKGMFKTAINAWVIRKGIAPRSGGKFTDRKQMLANIRRSIYNTGLRPSLFFTEAFNEGFKGLDDKVLEAYGLDVETFIKYSLKIT